MIVVTDNSNTRQDRHTASEKVGIEFDSEFAHKKFVKEMNG